MKQKLLMMSTAALIGISSMSTDAGTFVPDFTLPTFKLGVAATDLDAHLLPACVLTNALCTAPWEWVPLSMWIDPGMTAATLLEVGVNAIQGDRTIDAKNAIKQLEESLKTESSGDTGGGGCSGNSSMATSYTPENVSNAIEVSEKKDAQSLFNAVRKEAKEYLFETSDPDVKGDCKQSDKDCAVRRQNEWLLASVTLASATADKVLDQTAKKNVKDEKTAAEKSQNEKDKTKKTQTTQTGGTPLTGHLSSLAAQFNGETCPCGLYNAMANIVLDTHRHVNDGNALMGRDLEAQGLRAVAETGSALITEKSGTGEE